MDAKNLNQCLKLQRLLAGASEGLTLDELAKKLEVNPRTVSRYLAALRKNKIPLFETQVPGGHGKKRWKLRENPLKPMTFNGDEVAALYLACRFLLPLSGTFLGQSATEALEKIRKQLDSKAAQTLDRMLEQFHIGKAAWVDYHDKIEMIETLMIGCEDAQEVKVGYLSAAAGRPKTYSFRPYGFIYRDGKLFVLGFSCKSNAIRTLKIDRMSSAVKTDIRFTKPRNFDIKKQLADSVGIVSYCDIAAEKVRFRVFEKHVVRYLKECRWHDSQEFSERKDGTCVVELKVQITPDLKSRLLALGQTVEVLHPKTLREEIKEEIRSAMERYS